MKPSSSTSSFWQHKDELSDFYKQYVYMIEVHLKFDLSSNTSVWNGNQGTVLNRKEKAPMLLKQQEHVAHLVSRRVPSCMHPPASRALEITREKYQ